MRAPVGLVMGARQKSITSAVRTASLALGAVIALAVGLVIFAEAFGLGEDRYLVAIVAPTIVFAYFALGFVLGGIAASCSRASAARMALDAPDARTCAASRSPEQYSGVVTSSRRPGTTAFPVRIRPTVMSVGDLTATSNERGKPREYSRTLVSSIHA